MENTDVAPSVTIQVTDFIMPDEVANRANSIALPLFAGLALIITYLPLRSFYRVKNIAACSMMAVIIIINLMALVNGILWPSDDWTKWWMGYGLCDIEVLLRFPITMALATSLCCLTKGLADALDTEHAVLNPSKAQRRRKVIGDVMFCWFVPVMMMALHYIVQAGRYMIIPVWGCADQLDNSWPMLVIIIMWCPMFTLLNVYYAGLMFFRLYRHRKTISAALTSTGSGLAPRKFIKLVLISVLTIVIYLPVQTLFIFYAIPTKFVPYSWSRVHNPATWSPVLFLHTGMQPSLQWAGWAGVGGSAVMFAFFGFNDDAIDTYREVLVKCGAGKIWPSLRLSREERRARETLLNTMSSRGSLKSQFDLVGKAMKYFDGGSRKDSQVTGATLVDRSTTASRKGSLGTFSNNTATLSHIPTSTSTNASSLHKSTSSPGPTHHIPTACLSQHNRTHSNDAITPAPSQFQYEGSSISPISASYSQTPAQPQTPSSTTPLQSSIHRGAFSLFRTQLNFPFNVFALKSSSSKSASKTKSNSGEQAEMSIISSRHITTNDEKDIEAQISNSNTANWPHRTSSVPSHTTVYTSIWSSPSAPTSVQQPSSIFDTNSKAHTANHSPSHTKTHTHPLKPSIASIPSTTNNEDSIDPHSPKLGTRAYRERERREFTAASTPKSNPTSNSNPTSASISSTTPKKQNQTRVYADIVHQELGMHDPVHAQRGDQDKRIGGVVVTRSLEINEERAEGSASGSA